MKLLIPVDGSDSAGKTLEWAAKTFDKSATEYHLLYVIKILPDAFVVEYEVEDAGKMLKKSAEWLKAQGCKTVETDYVYGDPCDAICEFSDEINADQVLIGSHGRGGLGRLLMGSVSTAVLEHCGKPVIVYRNRVEKMEPHLVPANTIL